MKNPGIGSSFSFTKGFFIVYLLRITRGDGENMNTRVALIGIVVESHESINRLNELLHEYSNYIIGRMGLPYPKRDISIISVAIDAPQDEISALSGKLGMLPGIRTKTIYSKV